MHKPAHPGEVLREMYIEPLGLTVTETAKALGVTRKALSELVNMRSGISTTMALRLSRAFGTTPELWLNMQRNFDLIQAQKNNDLKKEYVLNWPRIFKNNFTVKPVTIDAFYEAFKPLFGPYDDLHESAKIKYRNTVKFINSTLNNLQLN